VEALEQAAREKQQQKQQQQQQATGADQAAAPPAPAPTPQDEAKKRKEELWQLMAAAEGDESSTQRALAARSARRERVQRYVGRWLENVVFDESANAPPQLQSPSLVSLSPVSRPFSP
ncbi:hypothetical protein KEM52_003624, partial [Ascosphaera acerosa]